MNPAGLTSDQIQVFLLAFVRITALLSLLPVFGADTVPWELRLGLSFLLAVILHPFVMAGWDANARFNLPLFVFMMMKEIVVGIVISFAASFLFFGVQYAGHLIDHEMGFAMAQVIDPLSDTEITATGQLMTLVFSILFLALNGHYFLLIAIRKSFELIPVFGGKLPGGPMSLEFTRLVADIFTVGLRMAAPVFVVLVLTSLSLGVIARTVPQINIYFVGLPLKIFLGLVLLVVSLPSIARVFRGVVDGLMREVWRVIYLMA